MNHQIKAVSFERVCATLLWSTSGETHGPTRIRDHVTFPYLDREKLLEECLQIVREHFRRLRYNPLYRLPHSKAIVSQPNSERFDIYFPGSRRWLSPAATPNAFTLAMLYHYRGVRHTRGAVEPTTCNPVFRAAAGCRELRSHTGLLSRTSRRATVPCLRESGRAPLSKGVIVRGGYGEFRIRMNLNGIRLLGAGDAATGTHDSLSSASLLLQC